MRTAPKTAKAKTHNGDKIIGRPQKNVAIKTPIPTTSPRTTEAPINAAAS